MLFAFDIEEARGNADRERSGDQKDCFEKDCEAVDSHHAVETVDREREAQVRPLHAE